MPYAALPAAINNADIIIAATNAPGYLVHPYFFSSEKPRMIIDLSVPSNIDPAATNMRGNVLHGIDEISRVLETTITKRNSEIPKALSILEAYQSEFLNWLHLQKHVPMLNDIKDKLHNLGEIHFCGIENKQLLSSRVNKTVGSLAMNLRYGHDKGCHYINAINEFLQPGNHE
jgi:glutamyl-tRNA reductase